MYTIAVIVGSLRKESFNKKLALALHKLGKEKDLFMFKFVEIRDIPLYNQDLDNNVPASVEMMKDQIAASDAVLFVTPEYNRSIPGVLKNALDWGSRPYGANVWEGKPAAMAGSSPGAVATAVAQSHLRSVLGFLGMKLTVQPELYFREQPGLIAEDGTVTDDRTLSYLGGFLTAFHGWIDSLRCENKGPQALVRGRIF